MAKIHFPSESNGESSDAATVEGNGESHVSKPVKRQRWATTRAPGQSGVRKRLSILSRHKQTASTDEPHNAKWSTFAEDAPVEEQPITDTKLDSRTIYVNVPLPEEAKDEAGHIKKRYARNKIRTARYTPLSFIPKNLWYQFHNIANIYFFFIIILNVYVLFPINSSFD